ncbi:uncharacterized protein VP01_2173g2 [Puccinia sorghi]|uniref:Uncharacterized protein n=1 Tax=Puccinia sorghi TaxID=27349 RepID=A0A0L6VA18_9BASI|nr:uncharacterized protein VP01_2173g2 [Puccinia sorghi]
MNSQIILLLASIHNLALAQAQDTLTINTPPSVPQCLPTFVSFHGGQPPYTISALPGGQPSATPLADLGKHDGAGFTWNPNLPVGTSTTLQIRDSTGVINYSQMFTIQSGDTSCMGSDSKPAVNPTTTAPTSVSTGTTSAAPSPQPGNSTTVASGGQHNMSSSATMPNATAANSNRTTNSTGAANNSSKGPSPFVPTTSNTTPVSTSNNNNASPAASPAASSAANSASSVVALCHRALLTGLGLATLAILV